MTLKNAIDNVDEYVSIEKELGGDYCYVIYAVEPWTLDSVAIVLLAGPEDDGRLPDEAKAIGASYFIEPFIIHSDGLDWETYSALGKTKDDWYAGVIYYTENDAYLE